MRRTSKTSTILCILLAAAFTTAVLRRSSKPARVSPAPAAPAIPPPAPSAGKARVTRVVDGDTLNVLFARAGNSEPQKVTVRLLGINTPELHARPGTRKEDFTVQPHAQEARDFLARLCPEGSEIAIEEHNNDKYGRLLGIILLPDGRDANRLLVEAGLAKTYFISGSKNDPRRADYERLEREAQAAKRGIWGE